MTTDSRIYDILEGTAERWVSFEYFPPRTEAGINSLHKLNEKLKKYDPRFVDVTWGAGGSTSNLTMQLCVDFKNQGSVPNLHLTCTNMEHQKIHDALLGCFQAGIRNVVALRGDPPAGQAKWEATDSELTCALDLVRFMRKEHGDYFNISVSGYPEGHPDRMIVVEDVNSLTPSERARCAKLKNENGDEVITVCKDEDFEKEMDYLVEKVNAGANSIITQMFFDTEVFLTFVNKCRARGITVPIIPGIMCIATRSGFDRMTKFCKVRVPDELHKEMSIIEDDAACKELGIRFGSQMCATLLQNGVQGVHFYTLNMGHVTIGIIESLQALGLLPTKPTAEATTETVFDNTLRAAASAN